MKGPLIITTQEGTCLSHSEVQNLLKLVTEPLLNSLSLEIKGTTNQAMHQSLALMAGATVEAKLLSLPS